MTNADQPPRDTNYFPELHPTGPVSNIQTGESLHITRRDQQRIAVNVIAGMLEQAGFGSPDLETPTTVADQA